MDSRPSRPQLSEILKLASLDGDVFEAFVLVKRIGTDVREGRRRKFNYIRVFCPRGMYGYAILQGKGQSDYIDTASRWFEGLINKDVGITKEVYSIHSVEFDRQMGIVVFGVCGSDLLVMFFCCVDGVYCALMVYTVRTEITEAAMELGDVCTVDD
ncbi:hypothetical protein Syun_013072 [Stephania yunnanensis]|uniref:Uncharacterized protein n=1 Tax=Stephania yunnanensis TaxID=152371 RepID=A0AAP0K2X9_9MAGN